MSGAERSGSPLLDVQGVRVQFGGLIAVDDVSFGVQEGEITALIGPNGAGKTTLFHTISGFVQSSAGTVSFGGKRIDRLAAHSRARSGMVRTFQIPTVFSRMRVIDNLLLASRSQPAERMSLAWIPGLARRAELRSRDTAMDLLEAFGLTEVADHYAGELSGGQRKLLEFARALMTRPRMLLLDEPLAGVNPALGEQLFEHVARVRDEQGITFLFVEHDMGTVMRVSDRVLCMAQGALIADGTPEEVRTNPRVLDAYLGTPAGEAG